jgi:hypothetical protein
MSRSFWPELIIFNGVVSPTSLFLGLEDRAASLAISERLLSEHATRYPILTARISERRMNKSKSFGRTSNFTGCH